MTNPIVFYEGPVINRLDAIAIGLTHYFTGKPCRHGHIDLRQSCNWDCRECVRLRNKHWRVQNPERIRELDSEWWVNNKQKKSAHCKKYRQSRPDKIRQYSLNAIARKRGADGSHTASDINGILVKQGWVCVGPLCHADLRSGYHVDHIIPLSLGGANYPENLQCLCRPCNQSKGAKHPSDWNGRLDLIREARQRAAR
jgi:5-methylcytosine-specific restriction endonuclease McrA